MIKNTFLILVVFLTGVLFPYVLYSQSWVTDNFADEQEEYIEPEIEEEADDPLADEQNWEDSWEEQPIDNLQEEDSSDHQDQPTNQPVESIAPPTTSHEEPETSTWVASGNIQHVDTPPTDDTTPDNENVLLPEQDIWDRQIVLSWESITGNNIHLWSWSSSGNIADSTSREDTADLSQPTSSQDTPTVITLLEQEDDLEQYIEGVLPLRQSRWMIKDKTIITTSQAVWSIDVIIPENTQLLEEPSRPLQQDLLPPKFIETIKPKKDMFTYITTIQYWPDNKRISFQQDNNPTDIQVSIEHENLSRLAWKGVHIMSSEDGQSWEEHWWTTLQYNGETPFIRFDTEHLTYFSIWSISGNFVINNDDTIVTTWNVTLSMSISGAVDMRFGNSEAARDAALRESYSWTKAWTISATTWVQTVYAAFRNASGDIATVEDSIVYYSPPGFTLTDTTNLQIWLDAADNTTITETAFGVSDWNDKSGNGNNASQPNPTGNQPDLISDSSVPYPYISFNNIDDYLPLQNINYNWNNAITGMLACAVFNTSAAWWNNSNQALLSFQNSRFFDFYIAWPGWIGFSYRSNNTNYTNISAGTYNDGNWYLTCASFDQSNIVDTYITVDWIEVLSGDIAPAWNGIGRTQTRFGTVWDQSRATTYDWNQGWRYYGGGIAELVYYDQAKTTWERQEIECYLAQKRLISLPSWYCTDTVWPIATIEYSTTQVTTWIVTATLTWLSEPVTITNNWWSNIYLFTKNESFTFEFVDTAGNTWSLTANVTWINGSTAKELIKAKQVQDVSPTTWKTVWFDTTYTSPPIVLATPSTDNNGDNYPIVQLQNITTTGFQLRICVDGWAATCDTGWSPEHVDYFIFDVDLVDSFAWIQVGTGSVEPDDQDTAFTFPIAFNNIPSVRIMSQTSSQWSGNIAATYRVDDITTVWWNINGCVHVWVGNGCPNNQPNETVGLVAIDSNLFGFSGLQSGIESIGDSTRTTVTFSPTYSNAPLMMVTTNDNNNGQDPKYPQARSSSTSSAQIRYCEQDGANDCDTHPNENVARFSLPQSSSQDVCPTAPTLESFTGTTETTWTTISAQFSWYFSVIDATWFNPWRYTTLAISDLSWTYETISNTWIQIIATWITTLSWDANSLVQLDSSWSTYQVFSGTRTFLQRDYGDNQNILWTYGTRPTLQIDIPAYQRVDTYQATITYTLYENDNCAP